MCGPHMKNRPHRIGINLHYWRRGWDSNPRDHRSGPLDFESSAFNHSATSPRWRPHQDSNLDRRFRRPKLYPLSYEGGWYARRDSNPDRRLRRPKLYPLSYERTLLFRFGSISFYLNLSYPGTPIGIRTRIADSGDRYSIH